MTVVVVARFVVVGPMRRRGAVMVVVVVRFVGDTRDGCVVIVGWRHEGVAQLVVVRTGAPDPLSRVPTFTSTHLIPSDATIPAFTPRTTLLR